MLFASLPPDPDGDFRTLKGRSPSKCCLCRIGGRVGMGRATKLIIERRRQRSWLRPPHPASRFDADSGKPRFARRKIEGIVMDMTLNKKLGWLSALLLVA